MPELISKAIVLSTNQSLSNMITKWVINLSWLRVIRIVGGFAVLVQALIANQPVAAWLGGFLLVSGFINMGCISGSCRVPTKGRRSA